MMKTIFKYCMVLMMLSFVSSCAHYKDIPYFQNSESYPKKIRFIVFHALFPSSFIILLFLYLKNYLSLQRQMIER